MIFQWKIISAERTIRKDRAGSRRARTIFQWKIVSAERPICKDRAGSAPAPQGSGPQKPGRKCKRPSQLQPA